MGGTQLILKSSHLGLPQLEQNEGKVKGEMCSENRTDKSFGRAVGSPPPSDPEPSDFPLEAGERRTNAENKDSRAQHPAPKLPAVPAH